MALVKCKECGTEVSESAKSCPKCGAAVYLQGFGRWLQIGLVLFALGIVMVQIVNKYG